MPLYFIEASIHCKYSFGPEKIKGIMVKQIEDNKPTIDIFINLATNKKMRMIKKLGFIDIINPSSRPAINSCPLKKYIFVKTNRKNNRIYICPSSIVCQKPAIENAQRTNSGCLEFGKFFVIKMILKTYKIIEIICHIRNPRFIFISEKGDMRYNEKGGLRFGDGIAVVPSIGLKIFWYEFKYGFSPSKKALPES